MKRQRPDYRIDAPGIILTMITLGLAALGVALGIKVRTWPPGRWSTILEVTLLAYAGLFIVMGGYMLYWSKVEKVRGREALLDLLPWSGNEIVLDVGCGRGLLPIAAAKRVPVDHAVGIDVWAARDQTGNCAAATLENARLESVHPLVQILTAGMKHLPFADESFDRVMSHWAVHNLATPEDRARALKEIVRVVRPGGYIVLADIQFRREYALQFAALGLGEIRQLVCKRRDAILLVFTSGISGRRQ